jgi:hypothetical protein
MPRISTTEANQALATTGWGFVSLHTADPGTTGASEVSGGSYARVAVTWGTPSSGVVANTNQLTINVPASTTVTYFGVWSTGGTSGGQYYVGGLLTPAITATSLTTVTLNIGNITITAA